MAIIDDDPPLHGWDDAVIALGGGERLARHFELMTSEASRTCTDKQICYVAIAVTFVSTACAVLRKSSVGASLQVIRALVLALVRLPRLDADRLIEHVCAFVPPLVAHAYVDPCACRDAEILDLLTQLKHSKQWGVLGPALVGTDGYDALFAARERCFRPSPCACRA